MPKEDEIKMDFIEGALEEEPEDNEKHEDGTVDDPAGKDTEGEDPSGKEDAEDPDADPKPKTNKVQKRIDTLTKKMRDLERDNIYLRGRLSQVEKSGQKTDDTPAQLSRDDFESDEAYLKALNAQNLEILRQEREGETKKQQETQKEQELKAINEQLDTGREKYEDFDEVALSQTHNVTQEMFDAAKGEHLEDILYVLGKNPAASNRIASLSKSQQIKEIGKIEARIEKVKGTKPKKKIPEETPVPTLNASGTVTPVKDISQMSQKERFAKWDADREAKLKAKHGLA